MDKGQKDYEGNDWKTTGPNKRRNLENITYSLYEEDYDIDVRYDWEVLLAELISTSIEDLARCSKDSKDYRDAYQFIFSDSLDTWLVAFGWGMTVDSDKIRANARHIISKPEHREAFLRHLNSKKHSKYKISRNKVVSDEGDEPSE